MVLNVSFLICLGILTLKGIYFLLPVFISNQYFSNLDFILEKEMATHSSVLAWRIPGMAEPGGLLSIGSHRVGHD